MYDVDCFIMLDKSVEEEDLLQNTIFGMKCGGSANMYISLSLYIYIYIYNVSLVDLEKAQKDLEDSYLPPAIERYLPHPCFLHCSFFGPVPKQCFRSLAASRKIWRERGNSNWRIKQT